MQNSEEEILKKIKRFGESREAGQLFYKILGDEIKYKTLEDIFRYWWLNAYENDKKLEDVKIPSEYYDIVNSLQMDDMDFSVYSRIDFIKELTFFLSFSNKNEASTFHEIYKNREKAQFNNEYFSNQAKYIKTQTNGITRDLCLYFWGLNNLEYYPQKSDTIFSSIYNFMKDSIVRINFEKQFKHSNSPKSISITSENSQTALDSLINIHSGKVCYVSFWAPWCAPCMLEMEAAKQLKIDMEDKDIVFIYLANNCSVQSWKATIANKEIDGIHRLLTQEDYLILQKRYNIEGIPFYLIFDKRGNEIEVNAPRPSSSQIKESLNKIL